MLTLPSEFQGLLRNPRSEVDALPDLDRMKRKPQFYETLSCLISACVLNANGYESGYSGPTESLIRPSPATGSRSNRASC